MRCVSICPVHARKVSQLKTSVAADESVMVDGKVDMFKSTPSHLTLTPRRRTAGLAGVGTAVLAHFVAGQVVHVGLALHDELFGILVALVKVVAAVEDAAVGVGTQPVQIFDDAVDVLLTLAGRVGVVQTQVELAAVLVCNGPVDVDGLGTADVQVAVGLGREAGMDLADLALGQIGVDDVGLMRHTPIRLVSP